eukprot:TRINITY_DN18714_c0_g1_i1.p1 TRINITY_DN18714_c0_g1~~TRINITY_DN18714_c0_g1_i1.p1  ORF type:complete len:435 (+),score=72.92 TRINITY_DN18714_c0_g1_i1:86-1390(+)
MERLTALCLAALPCLEPCLKQPQARQLQCRPAPVAEVRAGAEDTEKALDACDPTTPPPRLLELDAAAAASSRESKADSRLPARKQEKERASRASAPTPPTSVQARPESITSLPETSEEGPFVPSLEGPFEPPLQGLVGGNAHASEEQQLEERPEVLVGDGRYKGQWWGDQRHGHGRLTRADGSWYEGYFVDGKAHGHGKSVDTNGIIYEGQWSRGQVHGLGWCVYKGGSHYKGFWSHNMKSGAGFQRWVDGSSYNGQFLCGLKHGCGVYTASSGTLVFEGQFRQDKMHGWGKYRFNDGRFYDGQWEDGRMHGEGSMHWPNGSSYSGGYRQGVREGQGTFLHADGQCWTGGWFNDQQLLSGHTHLCPGGSVQAAAAKAATVCSMDASHEPPESAFHSVEPSEASHPPSREPSDDGFGTPPASPASLPPRSSSRAS